MRDFHFIEEMTAVSGFEALDIHDVDDVLVGWVGEDVHVIPRALPQAVTGIDEVPSLAAVIGAVEAAIGIAGFRERVDTIGVGRDGDADASVRAFGQTVLFEALPRRAAVV